MVIQKSKRGEQIRKAGEFKGKLEEAISETAGFKGSSIKAIEEFLEAASLIRNKRYVPAI